MPPTVFGDRWELLSDRPLGEGGQAQTFLVRDRINGDDSKFALKRLKNVNRVERFEHEIAAVQSLSHPNLLSVVDFSLRVDGKRDKPYMVSEFCAGGSLAGIDSSRWRKDISATLNLFAEICDGVGAAHKRPEGAIVHRDIKPENVLLRDEFGSPVICDFGIAYIENHERERLTLVDEAVGARLFIAPELSDGRSEDVKPWSDVYSLGKLLYWMVAGGRVFDREQHRTPRWNLASTGDSRVFEHINRLLDRMIVLDPNARFKNADEVAAAVRKTAALISRGARALSPGIPESCDFCRQGVYRDTKIRDASDYHNFVGSYPIAGSMWRTLICNECGHVQWFRIEAAKQSDWWT